jgi:hypothetical protein
MKLFKPIRKLIRAIRYNPIFPLAEIVHLEGPVELNNGRLVLCIPLSACCKDFIDSAKGTSFIVGESLIITMPDYVIEHLTVKEGSLVVVDNRKGKCHIQLK